MLDNNFPHLTTETTSPPTELLRIKDIILRKNCHEGIETLQNLPAIGRSVEAICAGVYSMVGVYILLLHKVTSFSFNTEMYQKHNILIV